jgi:hypothetical protein
MFKEYNLFYYYSLLFKLDKGLEKITELIEKVKMKNLLLIFQLCLISGLVTMASIIVNNEIINNIITVNENIKLFAYIMVSLIGTLAPLGVIFAFFVYFYIMSSLHVVEHPNLRKVLFSLSILGYLPILIGSVLNLILNLTFGMSEYGYTTLYGVLRPDDPLLAALTQEVDPFKFLGIILATYFYNKLFNRNKYSFALMIALWYIINLTFILFFS